MITAQDAARELLSRRRARKDLLDFRDYTHPNFDRGEHHRIICDALERVERGETRFLFLEAPPRHSKSELTSVALPAWWLGRNPNHQIIAVSYNDTTANEFGYAVRNLVGSPEYQNVFPGVELAPDAKARGRWRTNRGGIYVSAGVGGGITGKGAHLAIIDDPIKNREEADSPTYRERVWKSFHSDLRTRLMPGGAIVVMMTRWHEDDLIGRLLERMPDRWERVSLPAIANEGTPNESALWPAWYPLEELQELRRDYAESGQARVWHSMYQQDPQPDSGEYIEREWFKHRWSGEVPRDQLRVHIATDLAVTTPKEGQDPDYTVIGVFGVDPDDNLWALDLWRDRTSPDVWIDALLDLAAKWKPLGFWGEGGVIRRATEPSLKRRMLERRVFLPIRDESWKASIHNKSIRGQSFRARAALGKVWLPADAPWVDAAMKEFVGFPGSSHDDIFDVFSLMCLAIDRAKGPARKKPEQPVGDRNRWKTVGQSRQRPDDSWKTV